MGETLTVEKLQRVCKEGERSSKKVGRESFPARGTPCVSMAGFPCKGAQVGACPRLLAREGFY